VPAGARDRPIAPLTLVCHRIFRQLYRETGDVAVRQRYRRGADQQALASPFGRLYPAFFSELCSRCSAYWL
jgi:hypothetical protein